MRRSKPLKADPEKQRAWQQRSRERAAVKAREKPRKGLPWESAKRRRERSVRQALVAAAQERGCVARLVVPEVACWGPIDGHEVTSRGRKPGSHLDPAEVVGVCRGHHQWIDLNDEEANRRGLSRHSWESR